METHNFRVSDDKTADCAFPKNCHTRKLGEILIFYAVQVFYLNGITAKYVLASANILNRSKVMQDNDKRVTDLF